MADRPLGEVRARVLAQGAEIVEGPVARTGARGVTTSICLRDPDRNLVEVAGSAEADPTT